MPTDQATMMRRLHDEHAAALWSYCLRLTGFDHARAEDLSQETLLRAWRHPAVLEQPADSLRAWLFTVARNLLIDQWRAQRRRTEVPVAEPPETGSTRPADDTDELLLSWVVAEALTRLSQEHRDVLVECYYQGRPVAEAARRLGVPEGTVKSRTHYALRALRLVLEEMGVAT